ncbi:type II secretion system F family protein [Aquihabitans sp. McL0605]|uniref:type II secretion system F family protein n=1 Tax=Aquihabitans sp. McL0605 TaxID=3415671 RepID=UPI003CF07974
MSALGAALCAALVVLLLAARGRPVEHRPRVDAGEVRARRSVPRRWRSAAAGIAGVVLAVAAVGPVLTLVAAGAVLLARSALVRSARRRADAAVAGAVPDLVDLFLISASAGHPVAASLVVVEPRAPPPLQPAIGRATQRFHRGLPLAECLARLGGDLGPAGGSLTDSLAQAAASGVPLVPLLEGVARTARDQRRRRAQEQARRLPVTMLFPLVACILPAAVLLAVVPVLAASISSLAF